MRICLAVSLVTALAGSITASAGTTDGSDSEGLPIAAHYSLAYEIYPVEGRLEAHATIEIENPTRRSWESIPFLLYRLLDVGMVTGENGLPIEFETDIVRDQDAHDLQLNRLDVALPEPLAPGRSTRIGIEFEGTIAGYREVWRYVRDSISDEYTLLRDDTFAYPILSLPSASSRHRERRFTYDLEVSVPADFVVASGGRRTGLDQKGDRAVFSYVSKVPVWRLDIAAARFSVQQNEAGSLFVFVMPGHEEGARRVLEAMNDSVDLYTELFGPAGDFLGYTAIEIPAGWGSQAADLYFLQTAKAFEDPNSLGEVYHEVAHNWNAKPREDVKRCRYFDEAFASYFQALAERAFHGEEAWLADMEHSRSVFSRWVERDPRYAETPIIEYGTADSGHLSYSKGAWSLYVLHRLVGNETFYQIVRSLLDRSTRENVDFADFERIAEATSGRDLSEFFDEWFRGSESSSLLLNSVPIEQILRRYE